MDDREEASTTGASSSPPVVSMCDTQLPDSDPPFTFGLPDNIERSVQRARSSAVILQLKTLGNTFMAEAKKFDR